VVCLCGRKRPLPLPRLKEGGRWEEVIKSYLPSFLWACGGNCAIVVL